MAEHDNNTKTPRRDEKRIFLLPLILLLVGAVFLTLGFFSQPRTTGNSFSEYEFNRAVVENELPELEFKTSTEGKEGATSRTSKTGGKKPDFCPT